MPNTNLNFLFTILVAVTTAPAACRFSKRPKSTISKSYFPPSGCHREPHRVHCRCSCTGSCKNFSPAIKHSRATHQTCSSWKDGHRNSYAANKNCGASYPTCRSTHVSSYEPHASTRALFPTAVYQTTPRGYMFPPWSSSSSRKITVFLSPLASVSEPEYNILT